MSKITESARILEDIRSRGVPDFSVIVPARNEEALVADCIHSVSLAMREIAEDCAGELICVDNVSTDSTASIIEDSGATKVTENRDGVAIARQAGLLQSQGAVILTTDADSIVPSTWIRSHIATLFSHQSIGAVCGDITFTGIPTSLAASCKEEIKRDDGIVVWEANMSFCKGNAMSVMGYETGAIGAEGYLLALKMKLLGLTIHFADSPDIIVSTSGRHCEKLMKKSKAKFQAGT